jgi:hypothetical protein
MDPRHSSIWLFRKAASELLCKHALVFSYRPWSSFRPLEQSVREGYLNGGTSRISYAVESTLINIILEVPPCTMVSPSPCIRCRTGLGIGDVAKEAYCLCLLGSPLPERILVAAGGCRSPGYCSSKVSATVPSLARNSFRKPVFFARCNIRVFCGKVWPTIRFVPRSRQ